VRRKASGRSVTIVLALLAAVVTVSGAPASHSPPRAAGRGELTTQGTETTRVFANPNGSRTMELHAMPIRARRGDSWVPLDNTLHTGPDGRIAPAVSATPVVFSSGGSTPLVVFGSQDRQLTLRWHGNLPRPTLEGDTATYPDVLPGTDLRVKATAQGFSHSLIVKTPQAARDPRLAKVTFGLEAKGLTAKADQNGVITVTDRAGATAFQAAPPQMWDANPERRKVTIPVTVTPDELTLVPDQALLTDPTARFPIEIDPPWSSGRNAWALVYAQHPDDHYWFGDSDNIAKVGYSGDWEPKAVTVRSYFQFNVGDLAGKDIISAEFNIFQSYSASCTKTGTTLAQTTPISGSTSWNNPGGWVRGLGTYDGAYGRAACPAKTIGFNVRDAVADPREGATTLMLTTDEGDKYAWRKFDPTTPYIAVTYNDAPVQPWSLSIHGKECTGKGDPDIATGTPVLRASVGDPNGGNVQADFEWFVRFGGILGSYRTEPQASGTEFAMTVPAGVYGDGSGIAWRVRGWDGRVWGPWSIWCGATIDLTKPDKPPTVASALYPENGEGGAPGKAGQFVFGANGVPDVAEFKYRLSGQSEQTVAATNGTATVSVTPPTSDPFTLEVTSVDRAGNRALQENTKKYQFRVGLPTPPVGHWPLDGYNAVTAAPDAMNRNNATVNAIGPAVWTKGRINDALKLNGTSGYASTAGPVVDTSSSFTVSAWVKLDQAADLWYSALTQQGNYVPGFALQYAGNTHSWSFSMLTEDKINPGIEQAYDTQPPAVGQWTHLTGVYNASTRQMSLYVNGRLAGTAERHGNWNATGGLQIGRGMWNGNIGDYWPGAIDDVRIYDRALPDFGGEGSSEVDKAATRPTVQEAVFPFDEKTGTTSLDVSGNYRESTLVNGPTWAAGKAGAGSIRFDGQDDYVSTSAPVLRTDNSYTVSAWARPDQLRPGTLVSQDGANGASAFYLQYRGDNNSWDFMVATSDTAKPNMVMAKDTGPPQSGWSHLTGVYDASVPEIRLYVNSAMVARTPVPGGVNWSAPGGLQIGRAKWENRLVDFWNGWIDEVQVYSGVRTQDEIRKDYLNPPATRVNLDSLGRYVNHDNDHFFTNGPAPAGYRLEGSLGWLAPPGAPGTRLLYSCIFGKDEFTSVMSDCEGQRRIATLGSVYVEPPPGGPSHALYRCVVKGNGDHFMSVMSDCEGQTYEGKLGYALPYKMLYRTARREGRVDYSSETGLALPGYARDSALGGLATSQLPGTRALMQCLFNGERFSSTAADCEGQTVVDRIGWIWDEQPSGLDTVRLYRCTLPDGEHFDSTDPDCEGQNTDATLGYVLKGVTP
jgi:hypothetical protein